jgi:hypothetical protein
MKSALAIPRTLIWMLASVSFACLLGEFYRFWDMRIFACVALVPSIVALCAIAIFGRDSKNAAWREASTFVMQGALGGVIAAVVYDLFRVPFVMMGYPLFGVFPEFGKMLLGNDGPNWLIQLLGWTYHFSNGAALGIMFLAMLPSAWSRRSTLVVAGAAWALVVETILLFTPYRDFFKIRMPFVTFLWLTASAHLIFGLVLGWWWARRMSLGKQLAG